MSSPGCLSLARRALVAVLAAASLLAAAAAPASAAGQWFAGTGAYQVGDQCFAGSVTGFGNNSQAFVSYWTDPAAGYPAIGDKYWMRIHVGMVGFSCPWGIGDFSTKLRLPEGTELAIDLASSDPNDKVRCWNIASNGAETEVTNATWTYPADTSIRGHWCKSTTMPTATAQGYDLGYRMLAQGSQFVLNVPVRSTKRLAGMAGSGETTKAAATLDSGLNSTSYPYQWVTVFDRPTSVVYPAQPTTAVGETTARTTGVLNSWYRKGKAYVDLGTKAKGTYEVSAGPIDIPSTFPEWTINQDWTQLAPGTEHIWRLRFVDEQGVTTTGAQQTFKTAGTAPSQPAPPPPPPPPADPTKPTAPPPPPAPTSPVTPTTPETPASPAGTPGGATQPSGGAAGPSAPAGTPGPSVPGPRVASTAGPVFSLARGARLGRLASSRGVAIEVLCGGPCNAKAVLRVDARTARRLRLGARATTIASGRGAANASGKARLTLKASRKAARRLKAARSIRATLTVRLASGATRSSVVTLKR